MPPKLSRKNNSNLRLGYACLNTELRKSAVFSSRTLRLETFRQQGLEYVKELICQNLRDTLEIMKWNVANEIWLFRLSSEIFAHITNHQASGFCNRENRRTPDASTLVSFAEDPQYTQIYSLDFARAELRALGDYARAHKLRITSHALPYIKLGSPRNEVVQKSISDLVVTARMFKYMGYDEGSLIVVHLGGQYGDLPATLRRWEANFKSMPNYVKQLLVLENDEQTPADALLPTCKRLRIPLLFDIFHHEINPGDVPFTSTRFLPLMEEIATTWKNTRNPRRLKMHISEQKPNAHRGAHSDFVETLPPWLFNFIKKHPTDLMVEAKCKEQAVMRLYEKYFSS